MIIKVNNQGYTNDSNEVTKKISYLDDKNLEKVKTETNILLNENDFFLGMLLNDLIKELKNLRLDKR